MEIKIETDILVRKERKLNKRGGLTIPAEIRRYMDLEGGDKFMVKQLLTGDILLERLTGTCCVCGEYKGLRQKNGRYICPDCLKEEGEV